MDCIYINLIVVLLLTQGYISESKYCHEAVASVETAISCPTSKKELDIAARRKNCSKLATSQNCTEVENFVYHCTINTYRNSTLEVCAPKKLILGHCTEFNIVGGVIQDQHSAPCNETFPKCDEFYTSSDAYKYDDCYKLVHAARDLQKEDTKEKIEIKTVNGDTDIILICLSVFVVAVMVAVVGDVVWQRKTNNQQKVSKHQLNVQKDQENPHERRKLLSQSTERSNDQNKSDIEEHLGEKKKNEANNQEEDPIQLLKTEIYQENSPVRGFLFQPTERSNDQHNKIDTEEYLGTTEKKGRQNWGKKTSSKISDSDGSLYLDALETLSITKRSYPDNRRHSPRSCENRTSSNKNGSDVSVYFDAEEYLPRTNRFNPNIHRPQKRSYEKPKFVEANSKSDRLKNKFYENPKFVAANSKSGGASGKPPEGLNTYH